MSTDAEIIGRRIKRLREAKGWTQRVLAREIPCDRNQITKWEAGRVLPCLANRTSLAAKFYIPGEILFGIGDERDEVLDEAANSLGLKVTREKEASVSERLKAAQGLKTRRPRNSAGSELAQFRRMMEEAHAKFRRLVAEIESRRAQVPEGGV